MDLLTITYFINGALMIGLPILLGIFLTHKFNLGWKIWLIGGAIFILSQVVHIPFNNYILIPFLTKIHQSLRESTALLITGILYGLSAGIFEECARYGMFRWWIKDARTWRNAILAGAGHGGVESIILGLLFFQSYINLVAYRNVDLNTLNLAPDVLATNIQAFQSFWNAPWYVSMLGAVERIFTIPFHIMASVVVLQVFTRRPGHQMFRWLGLAIILHTLLDATAVVVSHQFGIYAAEVVFGFLALIDIIIIFVLRQPEPEPIQPPSTSPPKTPIFTPLPIAETSDNLEQTRYQ
jgi:uncharacterized membrane protein YhfC